MERNSDLSRWRLDTTVSTNPFVSSAIVSSNDSISTNPFIRSEEQAASILKSRNTEVDEGGAVAKTGFVDRSNPFLTNERPKPTEVHFEQEQVARYQEGPHQGDQEGPHQGDQAQGGHGRGLGAGTELGEDAEGQGSRGRNLVGIKEVKILRNNILKV